MCNFVHIIISWFWTRICNDAFNAVTSKRRINFLKSKMMELIDDLNFSLITETVSYILWLSRYGVRNSFNNRAWIRIGKRVWRSADFCILKTLLFVLHPVKFIRGSSFIQNHERFLFRPRTIHICPILWILPREPGSLNVIKCHH